MHLGLRGQLPSYVSSRPAASHLPRNVQTRQVFERRLEGIPPLLQLGGATIFPSLDIR